ncbi:MAG: hemolysin family protein, partial [Bacillota bacterium]
MAVRLMGGNPNDKEDEVTEEEIKAFVAEHGSLPEDEKDMIHSIFEFGDSTASDVMVPRIDIVAVEDTATIGEAVALLRESSYSRIPVYHESVDNIVGVVNLKDLLDHLLEGRQDQSVKPVMRRPLIIPEQKKAIALLHEMQKLRQHMAVVADEFGGTAGIVTMEDLVEEVVGDIRDEHDTDEQDEFTTIDANEVIVLGHVSLREINDELDWHLPEHEDYDTIGGLVFFYLGRIPAVGDQVDLKDITVRVEKMEGRRVERVRLKRLQPEQQADA